VWERHLAAIGSRLEAAPTSLELLADEPPAQAAGSADQENDAHPH
jgi:hypothetical protein